MSRARDHDPARTTKLCSHHFILSSPSGPTCVGVCRKCGERRTYKSAGEDDLTITMRRHRTYPKAVVQA